MLRAKKKLSGCIDNQGPGIGQIYLEENYSQLPCPPLKHGQLKNGHLLFVYHANDKSVAETMKFMQDQLQCVILPHHLRSLLKKVVKYCRLSREFEMDSFIKVSTTLLVNS